MKKIGLIGGMSWESTAPYYKIINEVINKKLGEYNSADCILHRINFQEIESTILKGDWKRSNSLLTKAAVNLEQSGVDFIAICSNTMHKCIPEINKYIKTPILHIVDATSEEIKARGIKEALLLGTRFTMEEEFNKKRFKEKGIQIITPVLSERQQIHDIIFEELCKGIISETSRKIYMDIIYKYCDTNSKGVILGCTEIGLLIQQNFLKVPVFDTTKIHAQKIALYAINEDRP